jgi:hypothetical protein
MHVSLSESNSLSVAASLHFTLPMVALLWGERVKIEFAHRVISIPASGACVLFCVIGC